MAKWPRLSIDVGKEYSMCFGCGTENPIGLKLRFQWNGETALSEFVPGEVYQGWSGTVHGGIIICLLDEAMSHAALFEGMHCATTKIQVSLKNPASIGETLIITASITEKSRKLVETQAKVSSKDGITIAEGRATHFIVNVRAKETDTK
jgi:uncharacterized protein (TIGR00369 family)